MCDHSWRALLLSFSETLYCSSHGGLGGRVEFQPRYEGQMAYIALVHVVETVHNIARLKLMRMHDFSF